MTPASFAEVSHLILEALRWELSGLHAERFFSRARPQALRVSIGHVAGRPFSSARRGISSTLQTRLLAHRAMLHFCEYAATRTQSL